MSERNRLTSGVRKALEFGLREVGQSQEMRAARRLAQGMPEVPTSGQRVLFLTPRDWASHVQWEALLGQALRLRGADVRFVTCGGGLELCDRANTYESPPPPCHTCAGYTRRALDAHGLPYQMLCEEWGEASRDRWPELDQMTLEELWLVEEGGVELGAHVFIPARWFLCRSDIDRDPLALDVVRMLLRAGRAIRRAVVRTLDLVQPDVVVILNGLLLFESIAADLASSRGIRVVSYERGFIHGTLHFAHGPRACRYEVDDHWPYARNRALEPFEEERLDRYLDDRRHGRSALYSYWPKEGFAPVPAVDGSISQVVVFTNLTWDTAVLGIDSIYPSMQDWLLAILRHLGGREGVALTIRIHPAEVRVKGWETREPVIKFLANRWGKLPSNVTVIGPEDATSSYTLMEVADLGLVYSSTVGLELALCGTPVVTGARPHYTGKGFTIDPLDEKEFGRKIDEVLADPSSSRPPVELARRYANLLFFEAAVPQPPASEPIPGLVRLDTTDIGVLLPGRSAVLDVVCDGILLGSPFVLGGERS